MKAKWGEGQAFCTLLSAHVNISLIKLVMTPLQTVLKDPFKKKKDRNTTLSFKLHFLFMVRQHI